MIEWDLFVGDVPVHEAFKEMPRNRIISSRLRITDYRSAMEFNLPPWRGQQEFEQKILPVIIKEQLTFLLNALAKCRQPLMNSSKVRSVFNDGIGLKSYVQALEAKLEVLEAENAKLMDQIMGELGEEDEFDYDT